MAAPQTREGRLQRNSNSYFQKEQCTFFGLPSAMRPACRWRPAIARRFPRIGIASRFPRLPRDAPWKSSRRSSNRARGSRADHAAAATGSRGPALAERTRSRIGRPGAFAAARHARPRAGHPGGALGGYPRTSALDARINPGSSPVTRRYWGSLNFRFQPTQATQLARQECAHGRRRARSRRISEPDISPNGPLPSFRQIAAARNGEGAKTFAPKYCGEVR
jgi:hypothetical protein